MVPRLLPDLTRPPRPSPAAGPAPAPARGTAPRIFAIHGVVEGVNRNWLAHYNFMEYERLAHHLRSRPEPYADLASALAGQGDALTIDDATYAAGDAAKLARACGHEVTLFVNPHNVIARSTYFFARLCLVLDRAEAGSVTFLGRRFSLAGMKERMALRQHVKGRLLTLAREEDREQCVQDLADALRVADRSVPRFFQTLDEPALRELRGLGVRLGNHGWTHAGIGSLAPAAAQAEITRARRWLEENFGVDAAAYAVPFGKGRPPFPHEPAVCEHWLLHDNALPPGAADGGIFNREKLRI